MVIEIALSALLFARESPHVPALQLFPRSIKTCYTYIHIYINLRIFGTAMPVAIIHDPKICEKEFDETRARKDMLDSR